MTSAMEFAGWVYNVFHGMPSLLLVVAVVGVSAWTALSGGGRE